MKVESFYDQVTQTLTHIAFDPATRDAVVIDPVLDFDLASSSTSTHSLSAIEHFIEKEKLCLRLALETHPHADHLSGSQYLKSRHSAVVAIGENITQVQAVFGDVFDLGPSFAKDGSQFDRLLTDGERVKAGSLEVEVIATPGHTPACLTYKIGDVIFTGDTLFIEDYGTGRCDFPKGSADALYTSIHDRLYKLPDETRVFVGHDYLPNGRSLRAETTIGKSKSSNIQLRANTTRDEFVKLRKERDAVLAAPRLLFQSVQVNIDGGRLPKPHANGKRYFVMPLNMKNATGDDGSTVERQEA